MPRRPRAAALLALAAGLASIGVAACVAETPGPEVSAPALPPPGTPPPDPALAGVPDGQWVYTDQVGWIWMPYGDAYTYLPPGGIGEPLELVYVPAEGWAWVAAPWVWGIGPWPYFRERPDRFAWYRHGWWREPGRWRYRAPQGALARGPVRPAPPGAPAPRAAAPPPRAAAPGPRASGRHPAPPAPSAARPERGREGGEAAGGRRGEARSREPRRGERKDGDGREERR